MLHHEHLRDARAADLHLHGARSCVDGVPAPSGHAGDRPAVRIPVLRARDRPLAVVPPRTAQDGPIGRTAPSCRRGPRRWLDERQRRAEAMDGQGHHVSQGWRRTRHRGGEEGVVRPPASHPRVRAPCRVSPGVHPRRSACQAPGIPRVGRRPTDDPPPRPDPAPLPHAGGRRPGFHPQPRAVPADRAPECPHGGLPRLLLDACRPLRRRLGGAPLHQRRLPAAGALDAVRRGIGRGARHRVAVAAGHDRPVPVGQRRARQRLGAPALPPPRA